MKNLSALALLLCLLSQSFQAVAADATYIPVGPGKSKKTVLAMPDFLTPAGASQSERKVYSQTIQQIITQDLLFMDQYQFVAPAAFSEPAGTGILANQFQMTNWKGTGADFLIKSSLTMDSKNLSLEAYLYEIATGKQVLGKRYLAETRDSKVLAHQFANDIINALTGLQGLFLTKIAMNCDRTGKKEIYTMDFDGTNVRQISSHRSTAMAPAWSPDGTKLAYSLYNRHAGNIKNLDLFEFDFKTSTVRLLSNRKGINSGAHYSPNGSKIALTMSFLGNPEIFALDLSSKEVTSLTRSFGVEVDPSYSPDGKEIAFVSSRAGHPMVYKMKADGSGTQRLTYAGTYNATPNWSPTGNKIVFAGWLEQDKHFDIFTMNSDGTKIERLSKNQGNNEDPSYSPDGSFVLFSSNRTGTKNVYMMNTDGTYVKRLTYGLGNCVAPVWSNPPKQ